MTTTQITMKPRKIGYQELADLPSRWENPTVDTRKYYQTCLNVWEVDKQTYDELKAEGLLVQVCQDKYYAGF